MKHLRALYLILSILIPLPNCQAQTTGSWQAVESLSVGTPISIRADHKFRCRFAGADDGSISCDQNLSAFRMGRSLSFEQRDVQQVRIEHPTASAFAGAVIGAGAGVGIASIGGRNSGYSAGAIFGILGGVVGRHVPIVPGTTIYQK